MRKKKRTKLLKNASRIGDPKDQRGRQTFSSDGKIRMSRTSKAIDSPVTHTPVRIRGIIVQNTLILNANGGIRMP